MDYDGICGRLIGSTPRSWVPTPAVYDGAPPFGAFRSRTSAVARAHGGTCPTRCRTECGCEEQACAPRDGALARIRRARACEGSGRSNGAAQDDCVATGRRLVRYM
eukprot:scaffold630_cov399-Prasinococcus_capsulatus_cf.AAC.42